MESNLFFNILTFDFPNENLTFYFCKEEISKSQKLHLSLFPNDIESIFPKILSDGTEFIYSTFTGEVEGFTPLTINLSTENKDLVKRYYDRQINYYFRAIKEQIVKVGYIKENQIWLPKPALNTRDFDIYEKYSIKVQIAQISNTPEIHLSYDGLSKVSKYSIAYLASTISPTCFKTVMFQNHLYKYNELEENEIFNLNEVYPVINFDLFKALGYDFPKAKLIKPNNYIPYLNNITAFVNTFLNTDEFRNIIPLNDTSFLTVNPANISRTDQSGNKLLFGQQTINENPYLGMFKGPFERPKFSNIHFFFIFHANDLTSTQTLKNYFEQGLGTMANFQTYSNTLFHTEQGFSIRFQDKSNPLPEIEAALRIRTFNPDVKYFAIYITPHSKENTTIQTKEIYYKVKEALLKRDIPTQVIDPSKMNKQGNNFRYSLPNIFIAIIAKLKGIPWKLPKQIQDELIVGIGAFKHVDINVQFIGSAFSFNNNGTFNRFEYFMKHEVDLLAGAIAHQIRQYTATNSKLNKLVIHFYKTMSDEELAPILKELNLLGLDIPVFIISINKTASKDLIAFDSSLEGLMPKSGTYINLGDNKYLLFNNTRNHEAIIKSTEAWYFPIKLKIECSQPHLLKEGTTTSNLIQQVYEFSKIYWKSVHHQNLPVTIRYPEMVAQIAPHFDDGLIPHFGRDNLWFL